MKYEKVKCARIGLLNVWSFFFITINWTYPAVHGDVDKHQIENIKTMSMENDSTGVLEIIISTIFKKWR